MKSIDELVALYSYEPLPKELSTEYRKHYIDSIPKFLCINGNDSPLYTKSGSIICNGYDRIVVGDYGAYVEFSESQVANKYIIKPGQEYRINDPKYKSHVKYIWLTINDESGIKIYKQKKRVLYADYVPKKYYIGVYECKGEENAG